MIFLSEASAVSEISQVAKGFQVFEVSYAVEFFNFHGCLRFLDFLRSPRLLSLPRFLSFPGSLSFLLPGL